jgi:hypothetical protein
MKEEKIHPNVLKRSTDRITVDDRKEISQLILKLVEEKAIDSRFSDRHYDRESEKHQLLNGSFISLQEVKKNIQDKARPYKSMFPLIYFREIYRLFGWPKEEADKFLRRKEVAMFTRGVIYGRFDKGVLLSLHSLNPYTGFIKRNFKHFQFLTDEGIEKLDSIIEECVIAMRECSTIEEFRALWYNRYGVSYQVPLF